LTSGDQLATQVQELLSRAARAYAGNANAQMYLHDQLKQLDGPLRLAVAGAPNTGKSTLVNALIGENLAPVEHAGATGFFTWYLDGPQLRAHLCPQNAAPYEAKLRSAATGLQLIGPAEPTSPDHDTGADGIDQVIVELPSRGLRHTHFLDTPGLPPADTAPDIATRVLHEADAVLFLSRTLAPADLRRLPPARGIWAAATLPIHTVVVLNRADETAGGRVDALLAAKQVARRRRREPDLAAVCQDVVAVSALLGHAARTLRHDEFAALKILADQPRTALDPHLLSTDRFLAPGHATALDEQRRRQLVDRLGLTGIRLATTLVRSGCHDPSALAESLLRHSGLAELQAVIADLFSARRSVLKARTALLGVEELVHREPCSQRAYLLTQLERVVSNAHEFREMRLLAALRTGRAGLPADTAAEARRLAGGEGTSVFERLGLSAETPPDRLWSEADTKAERWRSQSRQAQSGRHRQSAQVVVRSCEAILHQLG